MVEPSTPLRCNIAALYAVVLALASATVSVIGERSIFTVISDEEVDSCPFLDAESKCKNWPAQEDGKVWLYSSEESFGSSTYRRSFYIYVPTHVSKAATLVIYLHGGYSSGLSGFQRLPFHGWASGHQQTWKQNTASCKMEWDPEDPHTKKYKTASGAECDPADITTDAPSDFVVAYPSGLQDRRFCKRKPPKIPCEGFSDCHGLCMGRSPMEPASTSSIGHWEDGRSPSPNWAPNSSNPMDATQYRDDVGFINHIVETLITASEKVPTLNRVVVGGTSNGGMMTHRVGCHVGDAAYPALGNISALMINVAAMPNNIFHGRLGRQRCLPRRPLRVIYTVGKGLATPNCKVYPCKEPTVDGDGIIPMGTSGQVHNVNSPSLGGVVSHVESFQRWVQANALLAGKDEPSMVTEQVGFFTTKTTTSLGAGFFHSDVVGYVTDGGSHMLNGDRGDINVFETMLKFALKIDHSPLAKAPTKHADLTLPGYPHKIDLFVPSSAPRYGIIFLHGGGGTKEGAETSLGLTAEWAEEHSVVVAVPQGQSVNTCSTQPCKAYTWSNHVMTSGQDDVAFLQALADYIQEMHNPSYLYLSGHSNGGMMANRMWCETGSKIFDAFIAFDGPASELYHMDRQSNDIENYLPCPVPTEGVSKVPPFLSVLAFKDHVVGNTPEHNMGENTWKLPRKTYILANYAYSHRELLNDWFVYERLRAPVTCGEFPNRTQFHTGSNINLWSACEGRVAVVAFTEPLAKCTYLAKGHCISYLQLGLRAGLLDFALAWAQTDGGSSKYLPMIPDASSQSDNDIEYPGGTRVGAGKDIRLNTLCLVLALIFLMSLTG